SLVQGCTEAEELRGDPWVRAGMTVPLHPRIVLSPKFATTFAEAEAKLAGKSAIHATQRSVLLLDGEDIVVESLKLDGALIVRAVPGARVVIKGAEVTNDGWEWSSIDEANQGFPEGATESAAQVLRNSQQIFDFQEPGEYTIEGNLFQVSEHEVDDIEEIEASMPDPAESAVRALLKGHHENGTIDVDELRFALELVESGQGHLFRDWGSPSDDVGPKSKMLKQLAALDANYPGGLLKYIRNARTLLKASKEGANPLAGWTPSVPEGTALEYGTSEFLQYEQAGVDEVGYAGFVLVAGGLGERLGFSGIKVGLPVEKVSDMTYLQFYCESILHLQKLFNDKHGTDRQLPFAIMTSEDTHAATEALLATNGYFGMQEGQVQLMKQEKVPCLADNDAALACKPGSPFTVLTKPHGHGDVHSLMHTKGIAAQWRTSGVKWVCFFQDTNAMVFRAIPSGLGISAKKGFAFNSLCAPRKAKEAVGAITKLTHEDGRVMTLNVEYNQLDPLLRGTISPDGGDMNDATGFSPFPGNLNQLIIAMDTYVEQLDSSGGVIAEFVNPKYADSEKTTFKAPTRLECMMQDFPKSLPAGTPVGFTTMPVWAAYSPVKNSPKEGRGKVMGGTPAHSATSGELDIYAAHCKVLKLLDADIAEPLDAVFNGMTVPLHPRIVLSPKFATTFAEAEAKLAGKSAIHATQRSVLLLDGEDIVVESLKLDGALIVRAVPGARVVIKGAEVTNDGWDWSAIDEDKEDVPEVDRIRGFQVLRHAQMEYNFLEPGDYTIGDEPLSIEEVSSAPASGDTRGILEAHEVAGVIDIDELRFALELVESGQGHLFRDWGSPSDDVGPKSKMLKQLAALDANYPGGLLKYISNARTLLKASKEGANPLAGWTPSVPEGTALEYGTSEFLQYEQAGVDEVGYAGFVLVAGGLGERLGFSGIKVGLPVEKVSDMTYLQFYCESILHLQKLFNDKHGTDRQLPFAIMTSEDTHAATEALLATNGYFGMQEGQVQLMKQEKVPCLADNDAALACKPGSPFTVLTKPHGHGDVHSLMHTKGIAAQWRTSGVKWVCFFQDTNAMVFRAIPSGLGISAKKGFAFNSLCAPRKAKEAVGAITKLTHEDGRVMTLNVEYNQLDPLLRGTISPDGGDMNDATGFSPFPGNLNQLIIAMDTYVEQLDSSGGVIAEFVNPKYADSEKTTFKAPTRLECMMQDFPKSLPAGTPVGFTTMPVWAAYSPVKNSPKEGRGKVMGGTPAHSATSGELDIYAAHCKWFAAHAQWTLAVFSYVLLFIDAMIGSGHGGTPAHSATSGELDIYAAHCKVLRLLEADIAEPSNATYNGMTVPLHPRIVLSPKFATTFAEAEAKLAGKSAIHATQRSVLLLDGEDIVVESLKLDGALIVRAVPGARVVIKGAEVTNDGWDWVAIDEDQQDAPEVDRIRGFQVVRGEQQEFDFREPGEYTIEGVL
ncbi:hypothetical protein CYMTET_52593, partial [Cymbomonas tetramitiformis]